MRVSAVANVWLRPAPDAAPDRQVLVGDPFEVEDTADGWVYGKALKDGYRGCLLEAATAPEIAPTHWVSVRTMWGYAAPDIKSAPVIDLHMSSRLEAVGGDAGWLEVRHAGETVFVPASQVSAWDDRAINPVSVARQFLGVPYVWAGNTGFGLDCSGLVQVAYHACGFDCAADSQDQKEMPGKAPENVVSGDLIFWKDHVAIETGDGTLIHANAHHMSVTEEPRHVVMSRIAATDTGPVTARLRPDRRPLSR
ncbi:MAG: C40 family peptidase [Silicimonas sp.]|nr:C40 family peptidase [Silicimonas sp.]